MTTTPTHTTNSGAESPARPETPHGLHQILAGIEADRTRQLEAVPESSLDPVTAAYRGSIERILGEVRTARQRLACGLYGVCAACGSTITAERLELLRWATNCERCAARDRH